MFGLFHMSGWSMIEGAWAIDRPVHLVTRAEPAALLGAVERWHASGLYCIPSVWERVLADDGTYDTSSLVEANTGTSLVTLDLLHALKARFPGSWTSIAYGSTEIGRGATLLDPDLFTHPGSVGQPPPMTLADLADDGELWLRGPTMFSGYLDRPDATAEAIDEDGLVPHRRPRHPRRRRLPHHHRPALGVDPFRGRVGGTVGGRSRRGHAPRGGGGGGGRAPRRQLG